MPIHPTESPSATLYSLMMGTLASSSLPIDPISPAWNELEPRLTVYLRSFSGLSADDAEDLLQEVRLTLWREGPSDESDLKPWIYRVARNRAIDAQRRLKRERARRSAQTDDPSPLIGSLPSPGPTPETDSLEAEQQAFVRAFLDDLGDKERELLHLAFAEDMPYTCIAGLLGLPLGTVKWRIARLKRQLAARYKEEFE